MMMFLLLELLTLLEITDSLHVGRIRNARWNQAPTSIRTEIISCNECVCSMLMPFSSIVGLNCDLTDRTCHLFTNYSIDSTMNMSNNNDTFYFRILPSATTPPFPTTAANQLQMTTKTMPLIQIFWYFDNDTRDIFNVYNGVIINNASYSIPGINGYGSSIFLQFTLLQYVVIPTPALDLTNSSFTFELWINANSLDLYFYGLIGQCTSSATNKCLHISIRESHPYLGFFENDCMGQTALYTNTWYHLAFVYSYELQRQTIYVNGIIDAEKYSANSFQGSGQTPLTIGMILPAELRTFDGQIDEVSFVNRAKENNEILHDATLVVHYTFDSNLIDSGPMKINATGVNISFINQAVKLLVNPSYIQAVGFTLLGTSNWPYSIALWIYPYSITQGSLVYLRTTSVSSAWCLPLLGLSASGSITAQQYDGSSVISISSQTIPNATWTHIVCTYSINVGIQLYINGLLVNRSIPFAYSAMSRLGNIILGVNPTLMSPYQYDWQPNLISKTQYYGLIDEFHLYSRQLNVNEIYKLAIR